MSNPRAYLYGPRGPITRTAGVLAAKHAAVFAPWPRALDAQTPFLVRIVADDGTQEWAQPLEVELPRPDASGRDALGLVVLRQTSAFPIDLGPNVKPDELAEALQTGSAAEALPSLGPRRFGPLTQRSRPPATTTVTTGADPTMITPGTPTMPPPVLPDTFTVRNQAPPQQVAFSICRIFRWD